jgi:hypothetical protein
MMMRSSETDSSKVEDKSLQQMQSVHPVEISYSPAPLLLSNSSTSEAVDPVDVVSKAGGGAELVEIGMELAIITTGGEQSTCKLVNLYKGRKDFVRPFCYFMIVAIK